MNFLQDAFVQHADRELLVGDLSATYGEVRGRVFEEMPLKTRSLAILAISEGTDALLGYLACVLQGLIVLPVPESLGNEQLTILVETYRPKYVLTKSDKNLDSLPSNFSSGTKILFSSNFNVYECLKGGTQFEDTDLRLLLSTSGTTGDPKLVKLSENNLQKNTIDICNSINITSKDVTILTLPLNYSFGISVINTHIFSGGKIVCLNDSIITGSFWREFKKFSVTSFYGVPYQFEVLKKLRIFKKDLTSVRCFAQAGGHLSDPIKQWFLEHCTESEKSFFVMYGQTECSPRISSFDITRRPEKFASVGVPLKGCSVVAGSSQLNPQEIVVTGVNVFIGYASDVSDLQMVPDNIDQGHATGDIGYLDDDGFLYITGRLKRFVKIFGHNVNLDHLEGKLKRRFSDIAVTGAENKLAIFYTDKIVSAEEIYGYLAEHFSLTRQAISVEKINEIPRLTSGKVNYKDLGVRLAR